jgi:quinohemoprotein ethanol dehydrogenase
VQTLPNISRILVFKLGGKGVLPPAPPIQRVAVDPPAETQPKYVVDKGRYQFMVHCAFCHSATGQVGPDLRISLALRDKLLWQAIVHDGALARKGMVGWKDVMTPAEIEAIRAYFIGEAQAYKAQQDKAQQAPARIQ